MGGSREPGGPSGSGASPWRTAGADLLGLVLPVCCAGCGADDVAWCPDCAVTLAGPPWRCERRAGRLDRMDGTAPVPVWTVADFAGPVRRAVSAWKDHGRADLTAAFTGAVRAGAGAMLADPVVVAALVGPPRAPSLAGWRATPSPGPAGTGPLLVVPAPSTPAARRRRGWDPVAVLAAAVADELRRHGADARRAPVLRRAAGADQAGLSARARGRNLAGHVRLRRWPATPAAPAVLVDDVLTTGATFAACVRALEAAGVRVVAGVTIASTASPGAAVERGRTAR